MLKALSKIARLQHLINDLFYGYPDKADWPEGAKLFYDRMADVFAKLVIGTGLKPDELKRILEEEL
jgi:hypothetical protein